MPEEFKFRVLHPETDQPVVTLIVPVGVSEAYRQQLGQESLHLARLILTASGGLAPSSLFVETVITGAEAPSNVADIPPYLVPHS